MSTDLDWLDLDQDETLIWSGTPRLQTLYGVAGFAIAITIAPAIVIGWYAGLAGLLIGAGALATSYIYLINTEFVVTTKYAYSKRGVYGRSITKIGLKNIQDTSFNQGLLGRQFDYGTLFFSTAGGHGNELSFKHIDTPQHVQSKINDQLQELDRTRQNPNHTSESDSPSADALFTELTAEMTQIRETVDEINTHFTDSTDTEPGETS